MRNAANVPLPELLQATVKVIDRLLANRPTELNQPDYTGNMSDEVTGVKGVRVFFYTDGNIPGHRQVSNLQVNGPEPLLAAVVRWYASKGLKPWGRTQGHAVFPAS